MTVRRLTKCKNCKQLPEIIEGADSSYEFLLRHKGKDTCYPTFKLDSHQHTKQECIEDWNKFNT